MPAARSAATGTTAAGGATLIGVGAQAHGASTGDFIGRPYSATQTFTHAHAGVTLAEGRGAYGYGTHAGGGLEGCDEGAAVPQAVPVAGAAAHAVYVLCGRISAFQAAVGHYGGAAVDVQPVTALGVGVQGNFGRALVHTPNT